MVVNVQRVSNASRRSISLATRNCSCAWPFVAGTSHMYANAPVTQICWRYAIQQLMALSVSAPPFSLTEGHPHNRICFEDVGGIDKEGFMCICLKTGSTVSFNRVCPKVRSHENAPTVQRRARNDEM